MAGEARRHGLPGALLLVIACFSSGCLGGASAGRSLSAVRFESGLDRMAFEFTPAGDALDVVGRDGRLIVRVEISPDRLTVVDLNDVEIAVVTRIPTGRHRGYRLLDPDGETLRSEVRIEADGDLKLRRADTSTAYKIKQRDYGFKIVDDRGDAVSRVRLSKSGKLSIRDPDQLTYLKTRDPIPPRAAALLALPEISFPEAAGLAVAAWVWPEERS